jgi:hypothetical protein
MGGADMTNTHRRKYFLRIAEEGSITRAAGLLVSSRPWNPNFG